MNSAQYISELYEKLKQQGIALMEIAWKIALACVGWAYVFGARGQYCTPANRRARYSDSHPTIKTACKNYNGSSSEGCAGCKWYPGSKYTRFFDCRGFVYWVLKLVFGWELQGAGATSQWNTESNWSAKGTIDSLPFNILVCVFVKKGSKMEHVGFAYKGETCECSAGVQHFTALNKKWTHWACPACIDMKGAEQMPSNPVEEPKTNNPTLRRGNKGDWVIILQQKLMLMGYSLPRYGADGDFGTETLNAVKQFQKDHGLTADGVVGPKTWALLDKKKEEPVEETTYRVVLTGLRKGAAEEVVSKYGGTMTAE